MARAMIKYDLSKQVFACKHTFSNDPSDESHKSLLIIAIGQNARCETVRAETLSEICYLLIHLTYGGNLISASWKCLKAFPALRTLLSYG